MTLMPTESIDETLKDLDLKANSEILDVLLDSQMRAVEAVRQARDSLDSAVTAAAERLAGAGGRLILAGAGASGRLAVQDGAEMWPTYGWPHERLLLCMAGGSEALLSSIEGVEDDAEAASRDVAEAAVNDSDVVIALAASGQSPWTCAWLESARERGALTIGMSNNPDTRLLRAAECPVWLDSGAEVLAGSTRMAAGTAQKIALNLFSTTLMIRLNRTYGNLMVDMAAVNRKLDQRRIRLLQGVLPQIAEEPAAAAVAAADGWVKLAALIALGDSADQGRRRLEQHKGSLRAAMKELQ
ncbi:N-acetylmuramic acid 6-phosphate etherase [Granulosicoccus sp. 3-233]|uniref:N-acetylmuramic acid 6-phosphate etherase n=1 Tax=Granulosicoccus sp. 3-233 TaxID=3417969 RepID=UPI003D33A348